MQFLHEVIVKHTVETHVHEFRDRGISTVLLYYADTEITGEICAEPTAGEPLGRTRLARGVPSSQALAWTKASLTLSTLSRQLREACESPAVRRISAKTKTPRRVSKLAKDSDARLQCASVKKLHAEPNHRTRYDVSLTRVNVSRGVDVSNCMSCKDRQLLARTTVSCTYTIFVAIFYREVL